MMEETVYESQKGRHGTSKAVRIIADILVGVIGLSTGVAIVHGMVYSQCTVKNTYFVAGVLPPDMHAETGEDVQKCSDSQGSQESKGNFEAGVVPPADPVATSPDQPSAQGATPISQIQPVPAPVTQTSAPAPSPVPAPQPAQEQTSKTAATPSQKQPAKTQPAKTVPKTTAKTTAPKKTTTRPISVDLDKLSIAVAMQETHNCQDDRGAALVNNCHGFRKNGKFMSFSSPAESHAYFKQLWVKSYGGGFPTYRLAQIYSGNDHPTQWLKNVTYYYNNL